jgi:hypothetical protein
VLQKHALLPGSSRSPEFSAEVETFVAAERAAEELAGELPGASAAEQPEPPEIVSQPPDPPVGPWYTGGADGVHAVGAGDVKTVTRSLRAPSLARQFAAGLGAPAAGGQQAQAGRFRAAQAAGVQWCARPPPRVRVTAVDDAPGCPDPRKFRLR